MKRAIVIVSFILCVAVAHAKHLREEQKNLLAGGGDDDEGPSQKNDAPPKDAYNLVQLADPQLGMINLASPTIDGFLDWEDERKMLKQAAEGVQALVKNKKLSPKTEVIVHGDMQNWYPCDEGITCYKAQEKLIGQVSEANAGGPTTFMEKFRKEANQDADAIAKKIQAKLKDANVKNIGAWQTKDAKDALAAFTGPKLYLPGNHDIGDNPSADGLKKYKAKWNKKSVKQTFVKGKVGFIVLNSQVMQSDKTFSKQNRAEQFKWLETQMQAMQGKGLKGLVLMMHIPPFMNLPNEKAGWGNQLQSARDDLRDIIFAKKFKVVPQLIICGHFHNNVVKTFPIEVWATSEGADKALAEGLKGRKMELVVTSAVGARMDWGGSNGDMTPKDAAAVAGLANGGAAFFLKIMDGDKVNGWKLISTRIGATPAKSGARIFEFSADGYRHQFVTVGDLAKFAGFTDPVTSWNEHRDSS